MSMDQNHIDVLGAFAPNARWASSPAPAPVDATDTMAGRVDLGVGNGRVALSRLVATAPKRIYLDAGEGDDDMDFADIAEPTWSADNAMGYGVDYVRADLAAPQAHATPPAAPVQHPDIADAERVIEWARSSPRKPASLAFTAGAERQAAYWIEWAERERCSGAADAELHAAAQAVIARWDTPLWKDVLHTAQFIERLRDALAAAPQPPRAAQPQEARDG